jgi:hypothetical protein
VRIERVRVVVWPWFFRLPWFNRRGYSNNPHELEARRSVEITRPA